jgi:branched-chain amino acid transport system permease protein
MLKRPCGTFDETYAQDMAPVRTAYRKFLLLLLFVCLFGLLPLVASNYILSVMNIIGITVVAMMGLNILTGYAGLISVGHAAFIALGAYTSAVLSHHLGWPSWATLPCAMASSGLVGLMVGLPALRIKGFYIAISTLAAHYIILWALLHGGEVTKGVWGIPCDAPAILGFSFNGERRMYFLIITVAVLATILAHNLVRSRYGRAFVAVRDNDIAAEFTGLNVFRVKVLAFTISSMYAGVAGWLQAHYVGMITIEQFPLIDSIWYLGMLIVGGMGSITGAILGAFTFRLLSQAVIFLSPVMGQLIPALSGSTVSGFTQIFFGLVIIFFLVVEPRGLNHRWQVMLGSFRLWPFPY